MKTKKSNRTQKRSIIMAPIPHSGGKWVVVILDGNMRWKMSLECNSEEDAIEQCTIQRLHWRKFNDVIVCNRLATPPEPTEDSTTYHNQRDFDAAREQARSDFGLATVFRIGLSAAKLGLLMKNPYPAKSWSHRSFERGYRYWCEHNVK